MSSPTCMQAYAYASGRPLVNTDRSGRTIDTSGAESDWQAAFSGLLLDRDVGYMFAALQSDQTVDCRVKFSTLPGLSAPNNGGAQTDANPQSSASCGGSRTTGWQIEILYNPGFIQDYLNTYKGGLQYSADAAFAHEVAHAYNDYIHDKRGYPSNGEAVAAENAIRRSHGLPERVGH